MIPTLTDGVVRLDGFTVADADAHVAGEDEEMARRLGWWPKRSTRHGTLQWIAGSAEEWERGAPRRTFAVRDAASGALVGMCSLELGDGGMAQASYATDLPFRRRGYASRALRLACDWAFGAAGVERVELYIEPDNLASRGVARNAGFREVSILPRHLRIGDSLRDMVHAVKDRGAAR